MSNFTMEASVENDGKVITLDADEMDICIYQDTGNGMVRIFEITCDAPGGKVTGTLSTKVEYVGGEDDRGGPVGLRTKFAGILTDLDADTMEAYSNKYGG